MRNAGAVEELDGTRSPESGHGGMTVMYGLGMSASRGVEPKGVARDDGSPRSSGQRRRGLLLIIVGIAVGTALFVALIALSHLGVIAPRVTERVLNGVTIRESKYSAIWGVPVVAPLFTTLLGAIQVITGRSLTEFGNAYATMSGGRRFVVSVLVVALALAVIFSLVGIAFAIML